MVLVVRCLLYLCVSMIGREIKFMVIMLVLIILVDVVSRVLIRMVEMVRLSGKLLNSWFMDVSNCLVSLVCCSIIFMKINSGMVMSMVFCIMFMIWNGMNVNRFMFLV